MKKFFAIVAFFSLIAMNANAQFESGTKYISTSLSGLNLQYSSSEHFRFNVEAAAGMYVSDGLLLYANMGYEHKHKGDVDDFFMGVNARFSFEQNGIFLGGGAQYVHYTKNSNDFVIPVEIGYTYFLNQYITIEPAAYYKMSIHDFADNSTVGLKIGLGYYF